MESVNIQQKNGVCIYFSNLYQGIIHLSRTFARENQNVIVMKRLHSAEQTAQENNEPRTAKPKDVLEAFEAIVELAKDSKLNDEFFTAAANHIKYASKKLHLTPTQTVLLALFVDRSDSNRILISEIADYSGCRMARMLCFCNEIDALEKLRYVIASRRKNSLSYRIDWAVLDALRKNKPYVHSVEPVTNVQDFFERFNELMEEKNEDEISYDALSSQTKNYLESIKDSHFALTLKRTNLDENDQLLFIFMAHLFVENDDDNIGFNDIEDLFDNDRVPPKVKSDLKNHYSSLFEKNLIENVYNDGYALPDRYKLTDFAKNEMLAELNLSKAGHSDKELIKFDSFPEKRLIYNAKEKEQIAELAAILSAERFQEVQSRLRLAGMRPGFCCLFYGAPGTGKTETVYQLARQTGRHIFRVDVDKIKSCWVGESEKNIKRLFDHYRNICHNSPLAPILLFNEADAVLGVRMEGAARAVEKMENSIQNIILQEMESLEGIMIATTNLTMNLDKAFERRFLYKVKYEKPSPEARSEIWQSILPGLSATDATTLASRFSLSGGEIENIARKHSVATILSGSDTFDVEAIAKLCQSERINTSERARIGF